MKKNFVYLFLVLIVVSCAGNKSLYENGSQENLVIIDRQAKTGKGFNSLESKKRKILYRASIALEVKNLDTIYESIKKVAKQYKGYVHKLGSNESIIRVKSDCLNDAIHEFSTIGKVEGQDIIGQDVSSEFWDYAIRLENAKKARVKYLMLLDKAKDVNDVLPIEKELERLNEKIELLKGKINRLDHLSEYATLTIHLKEKKKLGILGHITSGLYYSIKWLFVRN